MRKSVAVLWLCLLGAASRGEEMRGMRHPALSPDGRRIAFDWHGDLWICSAAGGPAERVTTDPAHEQKPCWSPDGTRLAFSSDKSGNRDLFVLDLAAGKVRPLTYHSQDDDAPAWSPDGKWIAFQSNRDSNLDLALNNNVWDLWKIPAAGGTATRITRFRGENPAWSPDGKRIAYDRYASGYADGEHNVFLISADGAGIPRVVAAGTEDTRRPVFRGNTLYFAHEANGIQTSSQRNVWRTTTTGGALIQVTGHRGDHVTWPTVTDKSDVLVYEYDFDLYSIDLRQPLPKPRKLAILTQHSYEDPAAPRTYTSGFHSPSWSPSGATVAFSCRGDLWTVSAEGGDAKNVTQGVAEDREPSWSADEKRLVFVSGPFGMPGHVCVVDAKGGEPRRITREEGTYRNPRISSDGSRVVFTRQGEDETDLWIADVDGGEARAFIAEKDVDESFGCFSPDGKSTAYLSTQAGRTDVAIVPVEGGGTRIYRTDASTKSGLAWSPEGSRLAYTARPADGSASLRTLTIATSEEKVVATGARFPAWSPDGTMLVTEIEPRGGSPADAQSLVIYDTKSSQKMPLAVKATRSVTRREDMLGVYLQVWGSYAGYYYDPFFHGIDMAAVREKYRGFAEECQTKAELYDLVNEMIGELRSSHIRLQPARVKNDVTTGAIGADLVRNEDGTLRVWNVEPNGPAFKAGILEGEVIVGVGAADLRPETDLDRFFTVPGEAALSEVHLSVRDSKGDIRDAAVKPIDRMALRELKYENRIAWRKKITRERSQGRLAYHHLKMMVQAEVTRLKKSLEGEGAEAEGLVLDERDGVGGLAHRPLCALLDSTSVERLNASPACWTRNRSGVTTPDKYGGGGRSKEKSWDKPVILLQNEISRSDKEIFPYTFRHLGIGYLVGMPTAGGVIGGSDWTMQDGSRITVSVQGWFTAEGRNMEGWGVPPDFRVAETHEDLLAGRDAQLEKAIEVLLAQMDGKIAAPRKVGEKKSEIQPGK